MKRIKFVSQYYYPDEAATGVLLHGIAKEIACDENVRVSAVVAMPNYHGSKKAARKETVDRVEVKRVPTTGLNKNTVLGRVLNSMTFTIAAFIELLKAERDEKIVFVTCPPQSIWLGSWIRTLKRCEYYIVIHDIYPEIVRAVKVSGEREVTWVSSIVTSGLFRTWKYLNRKTMRRASGIVVLGKQMKERLIEEYQLEVIRERVVPIPNWSKDMEIKGSVGLSSKLFTVVMSGNLGRFQEFDSVIRAAKLLENEGVVFKFIGEGGMKEELKRHQRRIGNIKVVDWLPAADYRRELSSADLSLISLKNGVEGLAVPSRTYSAMAAGIPILAVMSRDSDIASEIDTYNCGVCVEPDEKKIAAVVLMLKRDRDLLRRMSKNARRAWRTEFTLQKVSEKYRGVLGLER